MALRMLSYLAPSLPDWLFTGLAEHLETWLGTTVELAFDPSRSGPRPGEDEPFSTGGADLAFLCATSYVWLTAGPAPVVELAGAAWVPTDPRAGGRPVYFGDVLVGPDGPDGLAALRGRSVAYNDEASLSGYHSLRLALAAAGVDEAEVRWRRSGSHLASLEWLTRGVVAAAAVDSTVWRRLRREQPGTRRLRPIATLGPHPTQPAVVRRDLDAERRRAIRDGLLAVGAGGTGAGAVMGRARLATFAPVSGDHYAGLRAELADLGLSVPGA